MTVVGVLLAALPTLLLAAALILGRYPGEEAIARLRARLPRPKRSATAKLGSTAVTRTERRRSGELLSRALAGRAPPAAPA
jgi:hypothetical protein